MTQEPKAGGNLDPEMLAAYIEQRLSPEQRAAVEAQLARDPEAYALLVDSLRTLEALDEEEATEQKTVEPVTFVPKPARPVRGLVLGGGLLAAAAALALVVLQPQWLQRLTGSPGGVTVERLVAAAGDERYFESRLAGGFKFGVITATRGSEMAAQRNLTLLAAATDAEKRAQEVPSPENLHAAGVGFTLLGRFEEAIALLERAANADGVNATFQNDLAAALFARARATGQSQDLEAALRHADRASELDPGLREARFNVALIAQALRLPRAAEAWAGYLRVESDADWRREAERLRSELPQ